MPTTLKVILIVLFVPLTIVLLLFLKPPMESMEDKTFVMQLNVRLESLRKKTKDYEQLKQERDALEQRITFYQETLAKRTLWARHLQNLALFTQDQKIWFGRFKTLDVHKRSPGNSQSSQQIILESFSAGRDLNIPNQFRKNMLLTPWWKESFQENGINDPAYEINLLPKGLFVEELYHTFKLECDLKPLAVGKRSSSRKTRISSVPANNETLSKIEQLENLIREEEQKQKEIELWNLDILQFSREYSQFSTLFPDDKKIEEFFLAIRTISDELNIPPFGFKPKTMPIVPTQSKKKDKTQQDIFVTEIPIQFEATYEQIGQFLSKIENYPWFILIKDLEIASKNAVPPRAPLKNLQKSQEIRHSLRLKLEIVRYEPLDVPIGTLGLNPPTLNRYEWIPKVTRDPFIWFVQIKEK